LNSCAIPIKLIPIEDPKAAHEEIKGLTETEKLQKALKAEAYLIWLAFRQAKIGNIWEKEFDIASYINKFYTDTESPSRHKLYESLKKEIVFTREEITITIFTKGRDFKETWWNLAWLYIRSFGCPWIIEKYYDRYDIITEPLPSKGFLSKEDADMLLDEVENHYQLLKEMEGK